MDVTTGFRVKDVKKALGAVESAKDRINQIRKEGQARQKKYADELRAKGHKIREEVVPKDPKTGKRAKDPETGKGTRHDILDETAKEIVEVDKKVKSPSEARRKAEQAPRQERINERSDLGEQGYKIRREERD